MSHVFPQFKDFQFVTNLILKNIYNVLHSLELSLIYIYVLSNLVIDLCKGARHNLYMLLVKLHESLSE